MHFPDKIFSRHEMKWKGWIFVSFSLQRISQCIRFPKNTFHMLQWKSVKWYTIIECCSRNALVTLSDKKKKKKKNLWVKMEKVVESYYILCQSGELLYMCFIKMISIQTHNFKPCGHTQHLNTGLQLQQLINMTTPVCLICWN